MTYASGELPKVGDTVLMINATGTLMDMYANRHGVVDRLEPDGKIKATMRDGQHEGYYEPWRFILIRRAASEAGKAGG